MSTLELARDTSPAEEVVATWVARCTPSALELLSERGPVHKAHSPSCTVVFEGVIHNRRELESAVGDASDEADLVLKGYAAWGVDVLRRMSGNFALAINDTAEQRVVLARDSLGIYPLFYTEPGDGDLLISTSIEALLACPGVSSAVNRAALADHLCHRWPDREETYFEAVKRVPPCHALVVERGARRLERYWDPAPPGQEVEWVEEDELEQFHELFDQAVNRCLSLGPTGIFLSGGLDSVSAAGAAVDNCRAQGLPEPLALSVVFPHPECDEEDAQRAVARALGLDQIVLGLDDAVGPKGLLLSSCAEQAGRASPMLNYYAAPYLQLAAEARTRGCKTIITGNGGDEWLTVTPLYAADLIRSLELKRLIQHVGAVRRSFNLSAPRVWHNALWRFGLKLLLASAAGSVMRSVAPGQLERHRRREIRKRTPDWVAPDAGLADRLERRNIEAWPERPTDGFYRHELRVGLDHAIVAMEMEENFENAARTGTRTLSPFLDADLVHFLYRVPPELLDRGGRAKGLVRAELARRFPDLGFERHKKISALSFSRGVALREGEAVWKELGGIPALAELGVVDPKRFERDFRSILAGREVEAFRIWDVLNLESWTRTRI